MHTFCHVLLCILSYTYQKKDALHITLLEYIAHTSSVHTLLRARSRVPNYKGVLVEYQFGSEEYPDYVGSGFNDVFGFFISGYMTGISDFVPDINSDDTDTV